MLIALMTDLHSNREAFSACLEHARARGAERFVFLGDYVGYGADPLWVVQTVAAFVAQGAIAIRGNHDEAALGRNDRMNDAAQAAIRWTIPQLDAAALAFLGGLPLTVMEDDRLYVHADASAPERWRYVTDALTARTSLEGTTARLVFSGHVHEPCLYSLSSLDKITRFIPTAGVPVPLLPPRRWLGLIGSVGQPRDGNPAAAYALYDTRTAMLTAQRVPYDIATAAAKIRAAGLPTLLADRLFRGH